MSLELGTATGTFNDIKLIGLHNGAVHSVSFTTGIQFGQTEQMNLTSVHQPVGRQFPIVVQNSVANYKKSSLTATVMFKEANSITHNHGLTPEYRGLMLKAREELFSFLTNKSAKIIRDWNGDMRIIMIVDSPTIQPNNELGGALADVTFNYIEIGNVDDTRTLAKFGLTNVTIEGDVLDER